MTYAQRLHRAAKRVTDTMPAGGLRGWRSWFLPPELRAAIRKLASVVNKREFPLEGEYIDGTHHEEWLLGGGETLARIRALMAPWSAQAAPSFTEDRDILLAIEGALEGE